jgi:hypothetical protein
MTINKLNLTREDWLKTAADLIMGEYLSEFCTITERTNVRVSVGYAPNSKTGSKTLGVCLPSSWSAENYSEIFITPEENDSMLLLCVLTHELIHAIDDCKSGHAGEFKRIALKAGFQRPLRELHVSAQLMEAMTPYLELLGDIPHAKIDANLIKPKQKGRNLKILCSNAKCGFRFYTSATQINKARAINSGSIPCLCCGNLMDLPDNY